MASLASPNSARYAIVSFPTCARVAQWIRALASGARGRRFDPCRGYQQPNKSEARDQESETENKRCLLTSPLASVSALQNRAIGNLQSLINDRERLAHLIFSDTQRRVREELIPTHERI